MDALIWSVKTEASKDVHSKTQQFVSTQILKCNQNAIKKLKLKLG